MNSYSELICDFEKKNEKVKKYLKSNSKCFIFIKTCIFLLKLMNVV